MPRHRITWIDSMKAFSIMAVVLYHTQCGPEIKTMAYILCLPAFFFAAGICGDTNMSPWTFFRKKTLRLLIPYILFGIISWVAWCFVGRRYSQTASNVQWWQPLFGLVCGRVDMLVQNKPLWFLCCMISLEWLYYLLCFIRHAVGRWIGAVSIAIAGCILSYYKIIGIWEITAAMLMLPIYMLGAEWKSKWITKATQIPTRVLIGMLSFSIMGVSFGYFFNPMFHISTCQVGNPLLFYITAFSVVGIWLSIALLLDKYMQRMQVLPFMGQHTLLVLCAHIPTFGIIKGIALLCNVSIDWFSTSWGCLVLWISSFILLLPLSYGIMKYCPILLGKRRMFTP